MITCELESSLQTSCWFVHYWLEQQSSSYLHVYSCALSYLIEMIFLISFSDDLVFVLPDKTSRDSGESFWRTGQSFRRRRHQTTNSLGTQVSLHYHHHHHCHCDHHYHCLLPLPALSTTSLNIICCHCCCNLCRGWNCHIELTGWDK